MSAALLRRAVVRWASRQLYETFVCPPTNHLAKGSFHSSTFVNGANQCSSLLASSPQNFCGSAFAAAYSSSYFFAVISVRLTNSAGGGNLRSSCITVSICPLLMPPPRRASCQLARELPWRGKRLILERRRASCQLAPALSKQAACACASRQRC